MGYSSTVHDLLATENVFEDANVVTNTPNTVISQYSSSIRVSKLAAFIHEHLNQEEVFESLFSEVFDVHTARGVHLDNWGAIVGVKRTTTVEGAAYKLDDDVYRELIMFRTAMNVSDASILRINELLTDLFETPIAVVDSGNMTMRIFVNQSIPNNLLAMLKFYGYMLKPAGVGFEIVLTYDGTLGFYGQNLQTFGFGVWNPNPLDVNTVGENG